MFAFLLFIFFLNQSQTLIKECGVLSILLRLRTSYLGWSAMGTAINHAAAVKRLEALFTDVKIDAKPPPEIHVEVETKHDAKCDVHGKTPRRGSLGNILHISNRRDSLGNISSVKQYHQALFNNNNNNNNGVGPRRESMPVLTGGFYR